MADTPQESGQRTMTFWVHGLPARSYEQVANHLLGDDHDRSKVQVFDGKDFHDVTVQREHR